MQLCAATGCGSFHNSGVLVGKHLRKLWHLDSKFGHLSHLTFLTTSTILTGGFCDLVSLVSGGSVSCPMDKKSFLLDKQSFLWDNKWIREVCYWISELSYGIPNVSY
jgi:hypothetical protein